VDARVVAATNRDLQEAMKDGSFREDLYFRLGVILMSLPPLRERGGDIILLAKAFLERYADENRKKIKGFTDQAIDAIAQYEWPGNVRELENRIKRAVIMAEGAKIIPADLDMAEAAPTAGGGEDHPRASGYGEGGPCCGRRCGSRARVEV
jgi:two-component system NtrC family response regulator